MIEGDKTHEGKKPLNRFFIYVSVVVCVFGVGTVAGSIFRMGSLLNDDILHRARSYFTQILITRKWNADYGGVFVEKKTGIVSNPWLQNPDIVARDGTVLTLRNPSLMTREISEIADNLGMFTFHITSLNPLNPGNAADAFEAASLKSFETGRLTEIDEFVVSAKTRMFRYIAPLTTEESCLKCHAAQGYKVGDIRGGISVSFDVSDIYDAMTLQMLVFALIACVLVVAAVFLIWLLVRHLRRDLELANERIRTMSVTDELTGAFNRRRFIEKYSEEEARAGRSGKPLSLAMLDLDHFKSINDRFGHLAGDVVLREITRRIKSAIRELDTVSRYGGEEFTVLIPEATIDAALDVAERIRTAVSLSPVEVNQVLCIPVTVSIGVATRQVSIAPGGPDTVSGMERHLSQADSAMYEVKAGGRNGVMAFRANEGQS